MLLLVFFGRYERKEIALFKKNYEELYSGRLKNMILNNLSIWIKVYIGCGYVDLINFIAGLGHGQVGGSIFICYLFPSLPSAPCICLVCSSALLVLLNTLF